MEALVYLNSYDGFLFQTASGIGFYWLMLFLHELGHLKALAHFGYRGARVIWEYTHFAAGDEWMYDALGSRERNIVYWAGILAGAPVLLLYSVAATWPFVLILTTIYFAGCWSDLKNIRVLAFEEKR